MAQQSTLPYTPLKVPGSIRLVVLQPGTDPQPIECDLIYRFLFSNTEYEALSYEWGEPSLLQSINIEGVAYQIRQNLWLALCHLRLRDRPRVLWIDALCINQTDTQERNEQVVQMDEIFHKALKVLVWLGMPSGQDEDAFRQIRDWARQTPASVSPGALQRFFPKSWSDNNEVLTLCRRSYWGRLWIIQEVAVSSTIILYCGKDFIDWTDLCEMFRNLPWYEARIQESVSDQILQLRKTMPYRLFKQRSRGPANGLALNALFDLLLIYEDALCSDIRDKVFGLHSLSYACCRRDVPINYAVSTLTLCGLLLEHHVLQHCIGFSAAVEDTFAAQLVANSQLAHRVLCVARHDFSNTAQDLSRLSNAPYLAQSHPLLKAIGNIRGEVVQCFPLELSSLGIHSSNPSDFFKNVNLSSSLLANIRYLTSIRRSSTRAPASTYLLNDLINVVHMGHLDFRASKDDSPLETCFSASWKHFRAKWDQDNIVEFEDISLEDALTDILVDSCTRASQGNRAYDYALFFERNGMIGFAPADIQIGDYVCQFKGSDIIIIVREAVGSDRNACKVISRAVPFLAGKSSSLPFRQHGRIPLSKQCEDDKKDTFDVSPRRLDLYMSTPGLQCLSIS